MEGNKRKEGTEREEIFSKAVRAGKRTYFFDVKSTRRDDYYLTITESKKRFDQDGRFYFEKHKLFLYKEDFEKFKDGLAEAVDFIQSNNNQIQESTSESKSESTSENKEEEKVEKNEFSDVEFDDLDKIE